MRSVNMQVLRKSLPCIASMLMESAYLICEAAWVAKAGAERGVESLYVSAIGILFTYVSVTRTVGYALGVGGGCLVSGFLGKKEKESAARVASFSVCASFAVGLFLGLLGFFCRPFLLSFLGVDTALFPYARAYATCLCWSMPFLAASIALSSLLRAEGKSFYSMIGAACCVSVTLIFDRLFLFRLHWGLKGVSVAFLLGQIASVAFFIFLYLKKKTQVCLCFGKDAFRLRVVRKVASMSIPSVFRQGWIFVANYALCRLAGQFGSDVLSSVTLASRLFNVFFGILLGIGQGYQPIAGFCYGKQEEDSLKKAFVFSSVFASVVAIGSGLLLFFGCEWMLSTVWHKSAAVLQLAEKTLRFQAFSLPFIPLSLMINMTYHVKGKKWSASFLASCRQGLVFLPLLWIFTRLFGILGLLLAQAMADILTSFVSIPFVRRFLKDPLLEKETRFTS